MNSDFFTEFYIDNFNKIYSYITRRAILRCSTDADDLVQDVFLLAFSKRDILQDHPNPGGWLMTAAKFACMAYNRGNNVKTELMAIEDMYDLAEDVDYEQAIVERMREEQLLELNVASQAIESLCQKDQEIYYMKYINHLSSKEISDITGMTISSVNVRVFRIREKVRSYILEDKFAMTMQG